MTGATAATAPSTTAIPSTTSMQWWQQWLQFMHAAYLSLFSLFSRNPNPSSMNPMPTKLSSSQYNMSLQTIETALSPFANDPCPRLRLVTISVKPPELRIPVLGQSAILYDVTVATKRSNEKISIVARSSRDFAALQDKVCAALDYGHVCDGICPWFFVDLRSIEPPKDLFRSALHPSVLSSHARAHQALLGLVLDFVNWPHRQSCFRARRDVPLLLSTFLELPDDIKVAPTDLYDTFDFRCLVCLEDKSDCAITTLSCGHAFHDECILDILNRNLTCPACPTPSPSQVEVSIVS
ncbi:hypothetical protein AC1031_019774 [Aphanomyces cochlioides]|nr:hypothetical protein AC1031_019774 [Aphanomyces cochlioides]